MAYCPKCGKEVHEEAVICVNCGCKVKNDSFINSEDGKHALRFILTFCLGFIGSFIINHTNLKPDGWKSRTLAYLFLTPITFGIYGLVAALCNFTFNANQSSNIGYFKE